MRYPLLPLVAAAVLFPAAVKADDCRASLVTGIDASASTGAAGMQMQLDGMVSALQSPAVLHAFASQNCVRVAVFLWSEGPAVVLLPWSEVATQEDAQRVAAEITAAASQYEPPVGVLTNVSGALETAEALLSLIPPTGRHVANIVSDGEDNVGEGPDVASARMRAAGITINAVLFGTSTTIEEYYRTRVTGGRQSFVMRVSGPQDFAAIYRAKFVLDVSMVAE